MCDRSEVLSYNREIKTTAFYAATFMLKPTKMSLTRQSRSSEFSQWNLSSTLECPFDNLKSCSFNWLCVFQRREQTAKVQGSSRSPFTLWKFASGVSELLTPWLAILIPLRHSLWPGGLIWYTGHFIWSLNSYIIPARAGLPIPRCSTGILVLQSRRNDHWRTVFLIG